MGITKEQFRDAITQIKSFIVSKVSGISSELSNKVPTSRTINGKALSEDITLKASDIGADPSGTAANQITSHNIHTSAHNDIRLLITGLTDRLNALANSDDTTLDQMKEVVAYIKANRELIESITTAKINVDDIIDNLTTNVANKPLSAAQGVVLKGLIDQLNIYMDSIWAHMENGDEHVSSAEKENWNNKASCEIGAKFWFDSAPIIIGGIYFDYIDLEKAIILFVSGTFETIDTLNAVIEVNHDIINSVNFKANDSGITVYEYDNLPSDSSNTHRGYCNLTSTGLKIQLYNTVDTTLAVSGTLMLTRK